MLDILSIVLLVFGALQIILFFKLWGMTNNVKKIYEKMNADGYCSCMMKGDKEEAYRIAVSRLYKELRECVWATDGYYAENAGPIIEKYRKMIEETGHKVPELLSLPEKFKENYRRISGMSR